MFIIHRTNTISGTMFAKVPAPEDAFRRNSDVVTECSAAIIIISPASNRNIYSAAFTAEHRQHHRQRVSTTNRNVACIIVSSR